VVTLLAPGLAQAQVFPQLNQALCLARGFQAELGWAAADQLIKGLSQPEEVVAWWHSLAKAEDPEGHLVLGWFARHGLITDPDDWPFEKRLEAARQGGWDVPDWMFSPPA
jgi:hypothetical protein